VYLLKGGYGFGILLVLLLQLIPVANIVMITLIFNQCGRYTCHDESLTLN